MLIKMNDFDIEVFRDAVLAIKETALKEGNIELNDICAVILSQMKGR